MDIIKKTKNRQKMSVFRFFNISFLLQTDKINGNFRNMAESIVIFNIIL